MLLKYRYHYGLVKVLSKRLCHDIRKAAFKAALCNIIKIRDYAECLAAQFNLEIESTHFVQSITLSMESYFLEFLFKNGDVVAHFHSHMADKSNQDAASTHAHLKILLNLLNDQGKDLEDSMRLR